MNVEALIIWHYYQRNILIGASTTHFIGTLDDLKKSLDRSRIEETADYRKGEGELVIPHQVIMLK